MISVNPKVVNKPQPVTNLLRAARALFPGKISIGMQNCCHLPCECRISERRGGAGTRKMSAKVATLWMKWICTPFFPPSPSTYTPNDGDDTVANGGFWWIMWNIYASCADLVVFFINELLESGFCVYKDHRMTLDEQVLYNVQGCGGLLRGLCVLCMNEKRVLSVR